MMFRGKNQKEAKKALEDLPDSLKQEAGVKRWGEVQSAVGE